jgi:hypothetical protein
MFEQCGGVAFFLPSNREERERGGGVCGDVCIWTCTGVVVSAYVGRRRGREADVAVCMDEEDDEGGGWVVGVCVCVEEEERKYVSW